MIVSRWTLGLSAASVILIGVPRMRGSREIRTSPGGTR